MEKQAKIGAIVLAAGRSVRFRSVHSKLIHTLGGRAIIHWPLARLRTIGAAPIVVVVGQRADEVRGACGAGVEFAVQTEPRGTGHAVLAAESAFDGFCGAVLILSADLPMLRAETLQQLIDVHQSTSGVLTMLTATVARPHGWGRIIRRRGAVQAVVEERDADEAEREIHEVNVGVYCVDTNVLFPIVRRITPENVQGEIYLTDLVARAVRAGACIADVPADSHEVGQINERGDLAQMEMDLRRQINAKWMKAGVTLQDPATTYIDTEVRIGRDTIVGPNVHLRGHTLVGEDCRLDGSAFLTDTTLGDRVHVRFGVVMTEAHVGAGCRIGPFAHLRPATRLAADVHIGNFVETKNAVLGLRTKANHLAYLGDTEIGSETNIGAGTITCNYDGFRKHRTVIGSRVQVGSDSQLVAPVTLGDDVYVASGTTVRRDVSPGALVFNPRRDVHRAGWVAARRKRENEAPVPKPARVRRARPAKLGTAKTATKKPGRSSRAATPAKRRTRKA